MYVNRFTDVNSYEAPNHFGCSSFRLQGFDASDTENFWVGLVALPSRRRLRARGDAVREGLLSCAGEITVITDTTR